LQGTVSIPHQVAATLPAEPRGTKDSTVNTTGTIPASATLLAVKPKQLIVLPKRRQVVQQPILSRATLTASLSKLYSLASPATAK
jgi:hypothetical protein